MSAVAPFRGLLYNPEKIRDFSKVVAPPYDVIAPEEQEKLYRKSPHNVVRLILNRDPDPYASVAESFNNWLSEGIFVRDDVPALYFLRQRFTLKGGQEKERQGFIALTRLEEFSAGNVRPHEKTMEGPKEDRFRVMLSCHANLSPIFGLYSDPKQAINRMLAECVQGLAPRIQVKEDGGGSSLLWSVSDADLIRQVQKEMEQQPLLIADGHHRYEAALRYRDFLRAERPNCAGREAFNYVMMYFANMRDDGLVILPTHRLVRRFRPIPFQQLEEALLRYFYVEPYPKTPDGQRWFLRALRSGGKRRHTLGASFKGDPRYLILRLKNKRTMQRLAREMSTPLRELDVTALHLLLLGHIVGLSAEEQAQEEAVVYSQDEEEVLRAVDREDYQAAFILNPPRPDEVLAVAREGEKMPPKSTYFYPKVLTGLVVNKIGPHEEVMDETVLSR